MASGENVLYVVEKRRYHTKRIVGRFLFRTRAAAKAFSDERNITSKTFEYMEPQRATWGPEQ